MDWREIRSRFAGLRDDAEQRAARLRARAVQLAQTGAESAASETGNRVLIFRCAEKTCGFPLGSVAEVIRGVRIAAVPGAPRDVAGLIQVRGDVHPVWSLRMLMGLDAAGRGGENTVVFVRLEGQSIAVLVDRIEEIRDIGVSGRNPPPAGAANVLWTTEDHAAILDFKALFQKEERWRT